MPHKDPNSDTIYYIYNAYMLRIWQETPNAPWRASLQSTSNNERIGFLDLQSLFVYLEQQAKPQKAPKSLHTDTDKHE